MFLRLLLDDFDATKLGRHDIRGSIKQVIVHQNKRSHDILLTFKGLEIGVFLVRENQIRQMLVIFDELSIDNLLMGFYLL